MADTKLSALTELAATPADSDEVYINDSGTSKKITVANLLGAVPRVIATASPSGVSEVDFSLPSGYAAFELEVAFVLPATDDVDCYLRFDDGGGVDDTDEYNWCTTRNGHDFSNLALAGADGAGEINLFGAGLGSAANEGGSVTVRITRALDSAHTGAHWTGRFTRPSGSIQRVTGQGVHTVASALTSLRVVMSSGNIADGELRLIGIP